MVRRRVGLLALLLAPLAVSCDTASAAPPVGEVGEACAATSFCMGVPTGWEIVDVGERHVTIEHPAGPDATIGFVEMDRVVEATGGSWPQTPEHAVRSLWALFDGGEASLDDVTVRDDGAVRSVGSIATGAQWHLLVPLEGETGIGIVVRAPTRSWSPHADAIFAGLRLQ